MSVVAVSYCRHMATPISLSNPRYWEINVVLFCLLTEWVRVWTFTSFNHIQPVSSPITSCDVMESLCGRLTCLSLLYKNNFRFSRAKTIVKTAKRVSHRSTLDGSTDITDPYPASAPSSTLSFSVSQGAFHVGLSMSRPRLLAYPRAMANPLRHRLGTYYDSLW